MTHKSLRFAIGFLVLLALLPQLSTAASPDQFAGGDGSSDNPYLIETAEQLNLIREDLTAHYRITADINLGGSAIDGQFYNDNAGWVPIASGDSGFNGKLDGGNHKIVGLYINRPSEDNIGLFRDVTSDGIISDLHFYNVQVTGDYRTGAVVGFNGGTLNNVSVIDGTITGGPLVGALAGANQKTIIQGAAGNTDPATSLTVTGIYGVGGLTGFNGSRVLNSYAIASVNGGSDVGGLAGFNNYIIADSYALIDELTSNTNAGGLVGTNYPNGRISTSYSGGLTEHPNYAPVATDSNGTLVGNNAGTVSGSSSFLNSQNSAETQNLSLIATNTGTHTPIELADGSVWNFTDSWRQNALINNGQPYLAWQSPSFVPTFSELSGPVTVVEPTVQNSITFADLLALSNAADNGSIAAFRVRTLLTGTLTIDGQPYDYANGVSDITPDQSAQWTTTDTNYGEITAFLVSVVDDDGLESSAAQALVPVTLSLRPYDIFPIYDPLIGVAATKEKTITIDVGAHFTPKHDSTLVYSATGLPDGLTISADGGIIHGTYTGSDDDVWVYNIAVQAAINGSSSSTNISFPLVYFSGGDLSQDEPYLIEHPEQLAALRYFLEPEYKFKLMRHLDLSDENYQWTRGNGWAPIGSIDTPFEGQFDGNNYTISNFFRNYSEGDYFGLFGVLGTSSRISNLSLSNVEMNGRDYIGALAGLNLGTVELSKASDVEIHGRDNIGGLFGSNNGTANETGLILGSIEGRENVGALAGQNASGQISASLTYGELFAFDHFVSGQSAIGGLVGKNAGTINDSGALMLVSGTSDLGTIVGVNTSTGVINRTIGGGAVFPEGSSSPLGNMLGSNAGTINDSFRLLIESDTSSGPGTGLTDEEIANSNIFIDAGWDLNSTWEMSSPQNFLFIAPIPRWVLNPPPPRITHIDNPIVIVAPNSFMEEALSAEVLADASDADFLRNDDALFRVVTVDSGQLFINEEPFEAGSNEYIGNHQGEIKTLLWRPDEAAVGIVNAFTVVAVSNLNLQESSTPLQVEILVNSAPQGNLAATHSAIELVPVNLDLNNFFNDDQGDSFSLTVSGSAAGLSVIDGVISGIPEEIGSYPFSVRATDEHGSVSSDYEFTINVIAPAPPEDLTPPPPPIPNVGDNSNALNNELDDIVLPEPGEPLTAELAEKLSNALNKANENVENTAQQIRNGNLSNADALLSLLSTNKAVGKIGDATQVGSGNTDAVRSLRGVSGVLDELATRGNLSLQEKQQVNDIAKESLSNGGKLIRNDSTNEEVESVLNATTEVLNNALKTGAPLDEELANTAIQLSLKALNQVLPGFAAALGKNVDLNDPDQVRNLMAEPVVLESALKNSIALRSTESLDDSQVTQTLAGQGINVDAAQRILESLRGAITNPSGINIAGDVNRSATQSLLDALLGAFGNVAAEGLDGTGLQLMAATQGFAVNVDPLTGAITVSNDTQRYAATSSAVRLVSASVPEGVSYLPDGRAVAIANGIAVELAPAAVDLLGFAAAIERNGFAVNFHSNGSFAFLLEGGDQFSASFAFDDLGNDTQSCGEISFQAPTGPVTSADYAFVMKCANGIQQRIVPFVHDTAFYSAISQAGLTVTTDRNSGIVDVTGVGRFKPSFFVTPLLESDISYRAERGNPSAIFRAVLNSAGKINYEFISATGVQTLFNAN